MLILFLPLPPGPLLLNTDLQEELATLNLPEKASAHLAILKIQCFEEKLNDLGQIRTRGKSSAFFSWRDHLAHLWLFLNSAFLVLWSNLWTSPQSRYFLESILKTKCIPKVIVTGSSWTLFFCICFLLVWLLGFCFGQQGFNVAWIEPLEYEKLVSKQ